MECCSSAFQSGHICTQRTQAADNMLPFTLQPDKSFPLGWFKVQTFYRLFQANESNPLLSLWLLCWRRQILKKDCTEEVMTQTVVCQKGKRWMLNSKHRDLRISRQNTNTSVSFLLFDSFICWCESADFFKCRHNDETMKPFPHTVFNISITCATQKRRGLPNTELHICTIHFFFNNIRDNRPFCRRRWWFPVNCVRTILNQKVKTLKFYTKVHLRVNECKTFTWQNGF